MKKILNKISKNSHKYLLLKVMSFGALAFIFDFVIGGIFNRFYFKQKSGWEYRTKYSVEETKADILIFGASRAQQQYNPTFFEERLYQSSYNVGRDGEPIFYHYGVLKGILSRYTPKMIILDIENNVFKETQASYDRISVLLPFYNDHPEMRPIIELRSPYEKLKLHSRLYPYNSLFFKIAMGNKTSKSRDQDIKGYVPLKGALNGAIRSVDLSVHYAIDSNKVNVYRSFINDCLRRNIKLYIVCSPYFINQIGADASIVIAKKIAAENNVDFIDFSRDDYFLSNSKLFDDTVHVNYTGSTILSNRLIDTIITKTSNRDLTGLK